MFSDASPDRIIAGIKLNCPDVPYDKKRPRRSHQAQFLAPMSSSQMVYN